VLISEKTLVCSTLALVSGPLPAGWFLIRLSVPRQVQDCVVSVWYSATRL